MTKGISFSNGDVVLGISQDPFISILICLTVNRITLEYFSVNNSQYF
jgi:hypothetical protein